MTGLRNHRNDGNTNQRQHFTGQVSAAPACQRKQCDACVPGAGGGVNVAAAVVEQDKGSKLCWNNVKKAHYILLWMVQQPQLNAALMYQSEHDVALPSYRQRTSFSLDWFPVMGQ